MRVYSIINLLGVLPVVLVGASGCGPAPSTGGTEPSTSALSTSAKPRSPCRGVLPSPAIAFPVGNELEFAYDAVGVQIYQCSQGATQPAWSFSGPEATLYDRNGNLAGKHYVGPTWESTDGSTVVGARVAGATPDPSAIPWLLLSALTHSGSGRMAEVTYVQRVATTGGIAPATGCDATTLGEVARVPYTATYCFAEADP